MIYMIKELNNAHVNVPMYVQLWSEVNIQTHEYHHGNECHDNIELFGGRITVQHTSFIE